MKLKILQRQESGTNSAYRGLQRVGPPFIDHLGEDAPPNRAFLWYADVGGEVGVVDDLPKAREAVTVYANLNPSVELDLIEATIGAMARPESGDELLGYDICAGLHLSAISSCLLDWELEALDIGRTPSHVTAATPLDKLFTVYFRSQLNEHLLFSNYEMADFCLNSLRTLQRLLPNFCESNQIVGEMEVTGLWQVPVYA